MNGGQTPALIWCLGNVEFDASAHTVQAKGDDAVLLDRNCAAVLLALLQAGGSPVDKDTLLTAGWPGRVVHENSLAKAISRLRQALADEGQRIEAVYGRGYQLTGAVQCKARGQPLREQGRPLAKRPPRFYAAGSVWGAGGLLLLAASTLVTVLAVIWARTALQQADAQWQRHEALLAFVSNDLLASTDPYATSAQQHALHDTVLQVAEQLDKRFAQDPATQLTFHRMLARAFSGWGQYEKAAAHLEQAARLVVAEQGDNAKQESILIDIALCQNLRLGGETRRAEPVCLRAEQNARHTGSAHLALARIGRAKLQFEVGQYNAAASALAAVLHSSALLSPAEQADAQWFYGLALRKLAHYDLAADAFRQHLTMRQTTLGVSHPLTGWAHADYGDFLVSAGNFTQAMLHLDAAQQIFDTALGPEHPESLSPAYSRARAYLWRGEAAQARDILQPMLKRYRETLGGDHFWTLYTMTELALAQAKTGEQLQAEQLLREARLTGARVLYGREAKSAYFHMRWARALALLGKTDEAEDERQRASEMLDRARFTADHPWRARLHCIAAQIALAQGEQPAAKQAGQACFAALAALDRLPETYPALAEARTLAGVMPQPEQVLSN